MKAKKKTQLNRLAQSVEKIIAGRDDLARQAEKQYAIEVENILLTQSHDARRIQNALDGILDFCFDPAMLRLYKTLCRYFYGIDPVATASYVYAYRDMWGEGRDGPPHAETVDEKEDQSEVGCESGLIEQQKRLGVKNG